MQNLLLHISLPTGLRLTNGQKLAQPVTFDVISQLNPYYATPDEVRLAGGPLLRDLRDITIACQIYHCSQEADLITPFQQINLQSANGWRFAGARGHWVHDTAAKVLLLNQGELLGRPGGHVLANLSVTRQPERNEDAGIGARLKELGESIKTWEVTIRSAGRTMPGGRPFARMAAKGVMDWSERTPARTWFGNGMGANATSMDPGSPTGGRGKPVKFFASPLVSPSFSSMRMGVYQPGYPLAMMYPYPMGQ